MTAVSALWQAEDSCRKARTFDALCFSIVNETWQVLPYRQASFWRFGATGADLVAVSGLAALSEDSPFTVWTRRIVRAMAKGLPDTVQVVNLDAVAGGAAPASLPALTPALIEGWEEWWPAHLVVVPLVKDGERLGLCLFVFENAPNDTELAIFDRLQACWSYCAWALSRVRTSPMGVKLPRGPKVWLAAALLIALMCVPVRQSALAPGELVALKAIAVAAPLDGVIKSFEVQPNQRVKAGALLFSLDDTTLRNRREVTARALEVAAAELLSAQQRAFDDAKARSEVTALQGKIAERRAELHAVEEQLKRIDVVAPRDGIAVFGDTNDWQGRPVVTGERVMQIADPQDTGVLVYLPAADAISLDEGAPIRLFLHVAPLSPVDATLTETSYQAVLSPDNVASYRLRGAIGDTGKDVARIGLKGTAKIYGHRVPVVYYLLRRPLAALRQWTGL
jgi:hypothetical protein